MSLFYDGGTRGWSTRTGYSYEMWFDFDFALLGFVLDPFEFAFNWNHKFNIVCQCQKIMSKCFFSCHPAINDTPCNPTSNASTHTVQSNRDSKNGSIKLPSS
jgi:hypothetical protein